MVKFTYIFHRKQIIFFLAISEYTPTTLGPVPLGVVLVNHDAVQVGRVIRAGQFTTGMRGTQGILVASLYSSRGMLHEQVCMLNAFYAHFTGPRPAIVLF